MLAVPAQLGATTKTDREVQAQRARAAVRKWKTAIAKTTRVVLPQRVGEKIPNYYGLALAFLKNSRQALKNVAADRKVNFGLFKNSGTSWVTKIDADHVTLGRTLLSGGTMIVGSFDLGVAGSVTVTTGWDPFRNLQISEGRWIAFPRDLEIPAETDLTTVILLDRNYHGNNLELLAATLLVKVPEDYVAPAGTTEIVGPITLLPIPFLAVGGDAELSAGSEAGLGFDVLPFPSPTPAEE